MIAQTKRGAVIPIPSIRLVDFEDVDSCCPENPPRIPYRSEGTVRSFDFWAGSSCGGLFSLIQTKVRAKPLHGPVKKLLAVCRIVLVGNRAGAVAQVQRIKLAVDFVSLEG